MMGKTVLVRNIVLGEGKPKICVPITGATVRELLDEAAVIKLSKADIVEWRVDFFSGAGDLERVKTAALALRTALGDLPLLFTFRTKGEGGQKEFSKEGYAALNREIAGTGLADLIDVELFSGDGLCGDILSVGKKAGVKVVLSSHDFQKTPPQDILEERLLRMGELGADIAKLAVMPQAPEDVLTLLAATCSAAGKLSCPLVTMSMGSLGKVSRISGEAFGSCMSFGTVKSASAPGQLAADDLYQALSMLSLGDE